MKLIKDLKFIARAAKRNSDENWEFRTFLKGIDMTSDELDAVVHRINDEISAQIDCTLCGNCCRASAPVLDQEDVTRFAITLEMPIQEFRETHLREDDDEPDTYVFNEQPCQFLEGKMCSNYEGRPKDCQSFPHLHKPEFRSRLWGVIDNYATCPIVFNVYEKLKIELWR